MTRKEKTKEINMNHICKIEGHAHLSLKIEKNKVKSCELKAAEGARFFEALVLNKKVEDVQEIVSRICGICSSAHTVAVIQALEKALGINPSEKQKIIREMLMIGERIRSHATHLYFLALPDYYGFSSALDMAKSQPEKVQNAVKIITLGNKIVENFGGREIHPFLDIKQENHNTKKDYQEIKKHIEETKPLIKETIELFLNIKYPTIERDTDYLSLQDKDYAVISGKIISKSGKINVDDYKKHLTENIKEYATSKFALKDGQLFQVGALSRINNNYMHLDSETLHYLKNLDIPLKNPFYNNVAQALELLFVANRALLLIDRIETLPEEKTEFKIKEGIGISAVEAPRGTLFHEYKINKLGVITYCNIITPTVQNLNMMEFDIKNLVNKLLQEKSTKEQIIQEIEKLIRAYDPCFSCSTHFLEVDWKE